jgi:shikimate kinase
MKDLKGVNLYLIGMMGSGKSTLGKLLAQELGYRFVDTDAIIEQAAKQPISDIFAHSGETTFRQLETEVLSQVAAYSQMAIATGGGIVLARNNWSYLRHGIVIWLDVPLDQLQARLQGDTSRPILQGVDLQEKLQTLHTQRQSLYAQADVRIVVADETPEQLVPKVLAAIQQTLRAPTQPPEPGEFVVQQTED